MRRYIAWLLVACFAAPALAHHPDRENKPVRRRIDVIPPLDYLKPMEYRRKYNRPTYHGGKAAYYIAPSSQEAMAWHRAEHLGYYDTEAPRMVTHYFYPKPWEALRTGPRPVPGDDDELLEATPDIMTDEEAPADATPESLDLQFDETP